MTRKAAEMESYQMTRHTIVAPHVRNDGTPSRYPLLLSRALLDAGIDGWTEYETFGSWRGKREPGTTFEIYLDHPRPAYLGLIARRVMDDQEAIQVTVDPETTLYEA